MHVLGGAVRVRSEIADVWSGETLRLEMRLAVLVDGGRW